MKTKKLSLLGKSFVALALSATLTSFADNAKAQTTLFDNGASSLPSGWNVYFADAGYPYYEAGNIFTPTSSGTANVVDFAGLYYNSAAPVASPPTDNFTISIYSVTTGAPNTLLSSSSLSGLSRSVIGTNFGFVGYEYSGALNTPFALDTSSSYYLGISDLTTPYSEFGVLVTDIAGPSTALFSHYTDGSFQPGTASLSFDLKAVPEPSTYALCGLGALALVIAYRRKQTA